MVSGDIKPGLGDEVVTPIAPGATRDCMIVQAFMWGGDAYYVLAYEAGGEPTFVVRKPGQFRPLNPKWEGPTPDDATHQIMGDIETELKRALGTS